MFYFTYIISYCNSYCSIKYPFLLKSFVVQLKREVWLNYQNGTLTIVEDTILQIEEGVWAFYCRYDTTIEITMINLKVESTWWCLWKTMFTLLCNQGWPRTLYLKLPSNSQQTFCLNLSSTKMTGISYYTWQVFQFFRAVNQMRE